MSAKYVRETYNVTYQKGDRLVVDGRPGTLVSFPDQYLGVRFDGERKTSRCHPTWRVKREPVVVAESVEPEDLPETKAEKEERIRKDINAYAVLRLKNAADKIESLYANAITYECRTLAADFDRYDLYDGPRMLTAAHTKAEASLIVTTVGAVPLQVELLHHVVNVVEVVGWDSNWEDSPLDDLIKSALDLADKILKEDY